MTLNRIFPIGDWILTSFCSRLRRYFTD